MRIIDKSIDMMLVSVECHQAQLCRCVPSQEARYIELRYAAQQALDALTEYRNVIDNGQVNDPLER